MTLIEIWPGCEMLYYYPTQILIFSLLTSTRRPGAWKVTFNRLIKGLGYLCSYFYEYFKGKKINFPINSYSGLRPLESKLDNKESSVHLVLAARLLQCIVSRRMLQLTRSTIFATVFCIIRIFFFYHKHISVLCHQVLRICYKSWSDQGRVSFTISPTYRYTKYQLNFTLSIFLSLVIKVSLIVTPI